MQSYIIKKIRELILKVTENNVIYYDSDYFSFRGGRNLEKVEGLKYLILGEGDCRISIKDYCKLKKISLNEVNNCKFISFNNCINLKHIVFNGFDFSKIDSAFAMFNVRKNILIRLKIGRRIDVQFWTLNLRKDFLQKKIKINELLCPK